MRRAIKKSSSEMVSEATTKLGTNADNTSRSPDTATTRRGGKGLGDDTSGKKKQGLGSKPTMRGLKYSTFTKFYNTQRS